MLAVALPDKSKGFVKPSLRAEVPWQAPVAPSLLPIVHVSLPEVTFPARILRGGAGAGGGCTGVAMNGLLRSRQVPADPCFPSTSGVCWLTESVPMISGVPPFAPRVTVALIVSRSRSDDLSEPPWKTKWSFCRLAVPRFNVPATQESVTATDTLDVPSTNFRSELSDVTAQNVLPGPSLPEAACGTATIPTTTATTVSPRAKARAVRRLGRSFCDMNASDIPHSPKFM